MSFFLSPQDVLDRCYFGVLFRSDPLRGSRNFRGTCVGYLCIVSVAHFSRPNSIEMSVLDIRIVLSSDSNSMTFHIF